MARIRSIKPEFPQSETVGDLSRDARLLFIQLWTIVDDDGRARGSSRMLASLLYPYDDDAPKLIGAWLTELEGAGCVRRYEIEGASYLDIPNWLKHQKIDKPSKSRLPEFVEASRIVAEPSRTLAPDLGPRTLDQDQDLGSYEATASPAEVVGEDDKSKLFRVGKTILVSFGVTEKRTGPLIGQWLKQKPDPAGVLAAIQYARDQSVAEPVSYISTLLQNLGKPHAHGNGQRKQTISDLAFDLAEEVRGKERAAGIHGSDDLVRGH